MAVVVDIIEEAVHLQKTPIVIATKSTERGIEVTAVSVAGADRRNPRKVETEMKKIVSIVLATVTRRRRKGTDVVPRTLEDDGNGIHI